MACRPGLNILVDEEDQYLLENYWWNTDNNGYPRRYGKKNGVRYGVRLHREIIGPIKKGLVTDHINGDKLDNRKCNLRVVSQGVNLQNAKKGQSSSIFRGVSWSLSHKSFIASINKEKRNYYIGGYEDQELAAIAYDLTAIGLYGLNARTNLVKVR